MFFFFFFFTDELYEEPTVLALLTPSVVLLLMFCAFLVASSQQACAQYSWRNEYTSKDGEIQPKQKHATTKQCLMVCLIGMKD